MKLILIIIFTLTLSLYSHEEHKIDEKSLLGQNIDGLRELRISKDGFLSSESDLDLNYFSQSEPMDLDRGIEYLDNIL